MEQNNLKNLLMIENRTEGEQAILDLAIAQQNLNNAEMIEAKDEKLRFLRINMAIEAITIAEKKIDLIKTKCEVNGRMNPIPTIEEEDKKWITQLRKYLPRFLSV